jgi:hypothetical protein
MSRHQETTIAIEHLEQAGACAVAGVGTAKRPWHSVMTAAALASPLFRTPGREDRAGAGLFLLLQRFPSSWSYKAECAAGVETQKKHLVCCPGVSSTQPLQRGLRREGATMMFGFDPLYLVLLAPGLLLALWAQRRTHRAFSQGKVVAAAHGITGAQAAAEVLQAAG